MANEVGVGDIALDPGSRAATIASVVVPLAAAGLLAVASATAGEAGVGVVVLLLQVPLVLEQGTRVKVDTRTGDYLGRVN